MYVVVGATEGLGKSIALNLAKRGLKTLVLDSRADKLAKLNKRNPAAIEIAKIDFSNLQSIASAIDGLIEPQVSGVVLCAGTNIEPTLFRRIDPEHLVYHFQKYLSSMSQLFRELQNRTSCVDRLLVLDSHSATAPKIGWGALSALKTPAHMCSIIAQTELPGAHVSRIFLGTRKCETCKGKSEFDVERMYKDMLSTGNLPDNKPVANFVSSVLVDVPLDELNSISCWDYTNHRHHSRANQGQLVNA